MRHLRSIVTFAAIAVPGVLVATTSFLTPLTPGTLDRSPEQVRMPTADTQAVCPGPLLTDTEAEGTAAEFVDDCRWPTSADPSISTTRQDRGSSPAMTASTRRSSSPASPAPARRP